LYKNVFIRTFIYSEINTFGLPKLSKISFAFKILPLSLCKNGLFQGYPKKITPIDVSGSVTIDQNMYLKNFRGVIQPP